MIMKLKKMEELTLDNQIEAILFWKGEPQTIKKLAENLGKKEEEILNRMTMEEIKECETDEEIRVGKRPSDEDKISRFLHTLSLPPVPPARRSKRVSKT